MLQDSARYLSAETSLMDNLSCSGLPNPQREALKGDQTSPSAPAHYPTIAKKKGYCTTHGSGARVIPQIHTSIRTHTDTQTRPSNLKKA